MSTRADKWEERYRQPGYRAGTEPAAFLREVLPLLPRGRALDLATGEGRNAVFLAAHGWHVTGIDRSGAALAKAEALARQHGVCTARGAPGQPPERGAGLLLICADLETYRLPLSQFDVVLCFNYLHRSLFPAMEKTLVRGGALVYETHTLDQLRYGKGPQNPEFLLRPGELREAFGGLETIFYSESSAGKGTASLLARKQ